MKPFLRRGVVMKIIKVLNQNAVLVLDEEQEKVAVGKGIGFNKKKNDLIFQKQVERLFVMEAEGQQKSAKFGGY